MQDKEPQKHCGGREAAERLKLAKVVAPETNGIMVDGAGNWFGHCDYHPTTTLVGPDGDSMPRPALVDGKVVTPERSTCANCTYGIYLSGDRWYHTATAQTMCDGVYLSATPIEDDPLAQSQAEVARLNREVERLKTWQGEIEEREAAVCPEDVGFDEYIRCLEKRLAAALEQLKSEGTDA